MIVRIGSWPVDLDLRAPLPVHRWLPWLQRHETDGPAVVSVRVVPDRNADAATFLEDLLRLQGLAPGPGRLVRCAGPAIEARVPEGLVETLDRTGAPRLLNILLCAAFNLARASRQRDEVLFHAAALVADGGVVLATGPSGAGKSTLAGLARPGQVLHDEAVALSTDGEGRILARGTPLLGSLVGEGPLDPLPVRRVALLEHGSANRRRRIAPVGAVPDLLPQIFRLSVPFPSSRDLALEAEARLHWASRLASSIPVESFSFAPEPSAVPALLGEGSGERS